MQIQVVGGSNPGRRKLLSAQPAKAAPPDGFSPSPTRVRGLVMPSEIAALMGTPTVAMAAAYAATDSLGPQLQMAATIVAGAVGWLEPG